MFLLDPVNGVTSIAFYRKVAPQSHARSFLYVVYLGALFTAGCLGAAKAKITPAIQETAAWMARTIPTLTLEGGRLKSAVEGPVTIRHPKVSGVAAVIDTTRTDPVTPQMMEAAQVQIYITANALYLKRLPGRLDVHDFSGAPAKDGPQVLDADFYKEAGELLPIFFYIFIAALVFPFFIAWTIAATALYSLMALMLNALMNGGLGYAPLLNITVYAQTLPTALWVVFLFMPAFPPGFPILTAALTGTYIALAVRDFLRAPPPAPAA